MKPLSRSARLSAFIRSGYQCAYPDCRYPASLDDGTIVLEVAHIVPTSAYRSRHDPKLSSEELNGIDNLIVLCPTHHRLVDASADYPADRLRAFRLSQSEKVVKALTSSLPPEIKGKPQHIYSTAMDFWAKNRCERDEEVWHQFFKVNPRIISLSLPGEVIQIGDKSYLGGKGWSNKGGSIVDFLLASGKTANVSLVEIKTPSTKLIGPEYRASVFSPSPEIAGSVVQVWSYRDILLKDFHSTSKGNGNAFHPKCLIIVGDIESEHLTQDQVRSFELFRNGLLNTTIITFDELFSKVAYTCDLLADLED